MAERNDTIGDRRLLPEKYCGQYSRTSIYPQCVVDSRKSMRNRAMRSKIGVVEFNIISPPIPELEFAGAEPKLRRRTQVSAVSLATLPSGHKHFRRNQMCTPVKKTGNKPERAT
jgi:hypothetical protein